MTAWERYRAAFQETKPNKQLYARFHKLKPANQAELVVAAERDGFGPDADSFLDHWLKQQRTQDTTDPTPRAEIDPDLSGTWPAGR